MADVIPTPQVIINAGVDSKTIEDTVNGAPDTQVTSRLGRKFWTLATINSRLDLVVLQADEAIRRINELKDSTQAALDSAIQNFEQQGAEALDNFQQDLQDIIDNDGVPAQVVIVGDKALDVVLDEKADKATVTEVIDDNLIKKGAALPYDPQVDYNNGAIVNDDGTLKIIKGGNLELAIRANGVQVGDSTLDVFAKDQRKINSRTVTPYDFGAFGDGLGHPLSERFTTLAAAQAVYPLATSLNEYIDGHALNMWWRDICANDRKYATCHGYFISNTNITNLGLNDYTKQIKTKHINFSAKVRFDGVTGTGWQMISPRQTELSGYLEMWDVGGADFYNRTIDYLLHIEDFIHAKFVWQVNLKYARVLGLRVVSGLQHSASGLSANNNTSDLGKFQFGSCGHRFKHGTFNFTNRVDGGGSSEPNQRSVLTLEQPHNLGDLSDSIIRFKGNPYYIESSTDNTVTVYPWLIETDSTGTIEISKGGDFQLIGADSNNITIASGSADCAICAGKEGFYVGARLQRTNEGNDVGLKLGNLINNAQVGGTYLGTYFEINEFDIIKTSLVKDNAIIINPIALNLDKCHVLAPISSTTRKPNPTLISPFTVIYGDKTYKQNIGQYYDGANPLNAVNLKIGDNHVKVRKNTATINLIDDIKARRLFGIVDLGFEVFGFVGNNGTSDVITVKCESGYTINGSSSDFVIPASNCAFKVSARLTNETDWRVYVFYADKPKASKTFDPPSIEAGKTITTEVSLVGVQMSQALVASFSQYASGLLLNAQVKSTGVVEVTFTNTTSTAIDLASGTLTVKAI